MFPFLNSFLLFSPLPPLHGILLGTVRCHTLFHPTSPSRVTLSARRLSALQFPLFRNSGLRHVLPLSRFPAVIDSIFFLPLPRSRTLRRVSSQIPPSAVISNPFLAPPPFTLPVTRSSDPASIDFPSFAFPPQASRCASADPILSVAQPTFAWSFLRVSTPRDSFFAPEAHEFPPPFLHPQASTLFNFSLYPPLDYKSTFLVGAQARSPSFISSSCSLPVSSRSS